MTDNIKPEHYRKGEIDLYEAFSQIFPHNEYRAGMQMIAMRYMFRDKIDRLEDLNKSIYTLERLKEKEIEHLKEKENEQVGDKLACNYKVDENIYLLKGFLEHGFKHMARDYDGKLRAYEFKPVKFEIHWVAGGGDCVRVSDSGAFPHIQWTDEEPTMISKLLATYENGGENGKVED